MAQKLNSQYGYNYDNLKVLLGGWTTWKELNAKDAATYPIEGGTGGTGGGSNDQVVVTVAVPTAAATP